MKIRADQLDRHLSGALASVYLVSGDEALLVSEALDQIRAGCREHGYTERSVHTVERGFDWSELQADGASMSLFAEKRIVELRLSSAKPGTEGARVLTAWCERPAEDTVLLISAPKMDKTVLGTKWAKAVDAAGAIIQIWPINDAEFGSWLAARMRGMGLQPDRDAVLALGARVEGNLLAAKQEIEKLWMQNGNGPVTANQIENLVSDNARFNVFKLVDAALAGQQQKSLRILSALRTEGIEAVIVAWALTREIRSLYGMSRLLANGTDMSTVLSRGRVWGARQGIVRTALGRHDEHSLARLLRGCAHADRAVKGRSANRPWDVLLGLTQALSMSRQQLKASA